MMLNGLGNIEPDGKGNFDNEQMMQMFQMFQFMQGQMKNKENEQSP